MSGTGVNLGALAEFNVAVVLDAIRRHPSGVTRTGISELTALSGMTVSNVCRRLVEAGLVIEEAAPARGRGKPPKILTLNRDGGFAVGVHIDPAVITYALIDLSGRVRERIRTATPTVQDAERVVREMAAMLDALLLTAEIDRGRVLGLGVASPGPIDPRTGVVLNPPMLPGWHRVELRSALHLATGLPVLIEKDATAAVVSELWFSEPGERRNFAFLYYGTGFATGVALGGAAVRGVSSNAGDTAHIPVDPAGLTCDCGRRGCVGVVTAPRTLVAEAVRAGVLTERQAGDTTDSLQVGSAFGLLADAADAGIPAAVEILTVASQQIARALVVVVNLLDVGEVVFGGPFWSRIAPVARTVLPEAVRTDPGLVVPHGIRFSESSIPGDVAAVGAATLVLDNAFSPRPEALRIGTTGESAGRFSVPFSTP
ncbi:ROK family transcriptional regulator [Streptomyces liangshanensis]|uniref:ROK family transcriptional regulator n=1 Tax=Streptomyces liangshanensis TaxID=2717324 RepID=UPI0036D84525